MADSILGDVSKMKVVELRKELRSRGLSYAGDKAELIERLQAAITTYENADIALDSDELDSEGVLDDEDEKAHNILDDSVVDTFTEELALEASEKTSVVAKPERTLKRKITTEIQKEQSTENKEVGSKKIVLNRTISVPSIPSDTLVSEKKDETLDKGAVETAENNKVKITIDMDLKTRLEMRAKRFGLPVKVSDEVRKEARKQRFGNINNSNNVSKVTIPGTLTDNLEKLKKRAERFGQSVSSLMTDIEKQEKLEKRKAKFGAVK